MLDREDDNSYWTRRATEHATQAMETGDPAVSLIHNDIARLYLERAQVPAEQIAA